MGFKIGICDDDTVFRKELYEQVRKIAQANGISAVIQTFDSLTRLDSSIRIDETSFDLLILDIYFNEANGFDYAKKLIQSGYKGQFILVSATRDYVLEGYDVAAIAYLVKPIEYDSLERAILRAYRNMNQNRLIIRKASEILSVPLDEILYLEVMEKKLYIHMSDNTVQKIATTLKSIIDKLPEDQFVQCYRSYIVSVPVISSINRQYITLINGEEIPIGRKYYANVQDKLLDWATFK